MSTVTLVGGLEIGQDLDFQGRSWMVQRVAWVVMPLIILAAMLGLFGSGPLSKTAAGSETGSLWLEYDRFGRYQGPMTLKIHLGAETASEGMVRLRLDQDYAEKIQIERVTPQPDRVELATAGLIYTFQVAEPNQVMNGKLCKPVTLL